MWDAMGCHGMPAKPAQQEPTFPTVASGSPTHSTHTHTHTLTRGGPRPSPSQSPSSPGGDPVEEVEVEESKRRRRRSRTLGALPRWGFGLVGGGEQMSRKKVERVFKPGSASLHSHALTHNHHRHHRDRLYGLVHLSPTPSVPHQSSTADILHPHLAIGDSTPSNYTMSVLDANKGLPLPAGEQQPQPPPPRSQTQPHPPAHHHHHHNPIRKLVGRFRSTGNGQRSPQPSQQQLSLLQQQPGGSGSLTPSSSIYYESDECYAASASSRAPSFIRTPRRTSTSPASSRGSKGRQSSQPHQQETRETAEALELWNEAYDALRDNPSTAGLVHVYEAIISQELPDGLKTGGLNSSSLEGKSAEQRLELLRAISAAGLRKRRGSKQAAAAAAAQAAAGQQAQQQAPDEDPARRMLDEAKDKIESVTSEYPSSAAIAWAGFCTLTPVRYSPTLCQTLPPKNPRALTVISRSSSSTPSSSAPSSAPPSAAPSAASPGTRT